jgi:hypothetical protein
MYIVNKSSIEWLYDCTTKINGNRKLLFYTQTIKKKKKKLNSCLLSIVSCNLLNILKEN